MTKRRSDPERKLLDAARALLPKTGFSGLSVREVARRADVNLGLFHYHFGSKEAFTSRLLQETYEDFLAAFSQAAQGPGEPLERLRRTLVAFGRFVRDHRVFYAVLAREVLNRHPQSLAFLRRNFPRHAAIIVELMEECRRSGALRPLPLPALVAFAMAGMGLPNVLAAALEGQGIPSLLGQPLPRWTRMMLSDEAIQERADMILAGLRARRAG